MAHEGSKSADDGAGIEHSDKINRGNYTFSVAGTATWIGLRGLDPLLQYGIFYRGLGARLFSLVGVSALDPRAVAAASNVGSGLTALDPRVPLMAMSTIAAAKHWFWILSLNREYFPPSFALGVGAFNLAFDSAASLLLLFPSMSTASGPQIRLPGTDYTVSAYVAAGTALFTVGSAVELLAELQRKWFKARPENKGKIYAGGLWKWARHINYGAYMTWRGGYLLAAGGVVPGVLLVTFLLREFLGMSVKGMDEYMTKRYGEQWIKYKTDTPYLMFPGIF